MKSHSSESLKMLAAIRRRELTEVDDALICEALTGAFFDQNGNLDEHQLQVLTELYARVTAQPIRRAIR